MAGTGLSGSFDREDREYKWEILSINTFDGGEITASELEGEDEGDEFLEADQVYYVVTDDKGEEFYRWLGGPYEDVSSIEGAIMDDTDFYESDES